MLAACILKPGSYQNVYLTPFLAHSCSLYSLPKGNNVSQYLLGTFICALKKDLDPCHSSVIESIPIWEETGKSESFIRAVGVQKTQGYTAHARRGEESFLKWRCLCCVRKGKGEREAVQDRKNHVSTGRREQL